MFSSGFSTPLTIGSTALNTALQFGGALRKGALLVHSTDSDCLRAVMLGAVKSNQPATTVLLAQEEESDLAQIDLNQFGVDTARNDLGSKLLRVKFDTLDDLKPYLMLGGCDLICIYLTQRQDDISPSLEALVSLCEQQDIAIVIFSPSYELLENCYASIKIENIYNLKGQDNDDYGWQFSAKAHSPLHQHDAPKPSTETIITKTGDYYQPFDALMAALSSGVLCQREDGAIFAGEKPFTASFEKAVQRLQEPIVHLRLVNAILLKIPFVRL